MPSHVALERKYGYVGNFANATTCTRTYYTKYIHSNVHAFLIFLRKDTLGLRLSLAQLLHSAKRYFHSLTEIPPTPDTTRSPGDIFLFLAS
jgi:hypothetical protein